MKADERWKCFSIDEVFLESKGAWLGEDRGLNSNGLRFFELAGKLVSFSRFHYPLASVAFFQAIPGLECVLKDRFKDEDSKLKKLLKQAVDDNLIMDSLFGNIPPFTVEFLKMVKRLRPKIPTAPHVVLLTELVPILRNQYFHGTYLLAPDYLHLTFQLRNIADELMRKK